MASSLMDAIWGGFGGRSVAAAWGGERAREPCAEALVRAGSQKPPSSACFQITDHNSMTPWGCRCVPCPAQGSNQLSRMRCQNHSRRQAQHRAQSKPARPAAASGKSNLQPYIMVFFGRLTGEFFHGGCKELTVILLGSSFMNFRGM